MLIIYTVVVLLLSAPVFYVPATSIPLPNGRTLADVDPLASSASGTLFSELVTHCSAPSPGWRRRGATPPPSSTWLCSSTTCAFRAAAGSTSA